MYIYIYIYCVYIYIYIYVNICLYICTYKCLRMSCALPAGRSPDTRLQEGSAWPGTSLVFAAGGDDSVRATEVRACDDRAQALS